MQTQTTPELTEKQPPVDMPNTDMPVPVDHLEFAAFYLYMATTPEGGLPWDLLTNDQRTRYRNLAKMAARMTDVTALRAAFECGASGLATHMDLALQACSGPGRRSLRFQAMDCIRAFEDSLMAGDEQSDRLTLKLQDDERQEHIDELHARALRELHARALREDEAETVKRQARLDIEAVEGRHA